ncbi:hypothetical protein SAY86_006863 [Trapa natans]|uniref:Hydroxyethylthiazole kinase n=1 Tax=Trapa natans TaxID=22666 RepID=A0AAN7LCX6_TRANT|nr:hypothetical protein SAY86_006863 [Trapa natans]
MEEVTSEGEAEAIEWAPLAWSLLSRVRQQSPLIQCITNFVSMDLVANVLLSAGASPAMIHSLEELPDFTPNVDALCLNVGTLSSDWLPAMKAAACLAGQFGKPWILDPVAAGATAFRLKACLELVDLKPTVIRGNGSEIIALSNASMGTAKGVDSSHNSMDAVDAAKSLALLSGSVVAVTGAVDVITDGNRVIGAANGVPLLQKITASGCSVSALIAAFVAVDPKLAFEATASALSVFGVAAEMGMEMAKGPALLRVHLIDCLYNIDETSVLSRSKITSIK